MGQSGMIWRICQRGTIVVVTLKRRDGSVEVVPFDHRLFIHMLAAEGCTPEQLVGRRASFDGEVLKFEE